MGRRCWRSVLTPAQHRASLALIADLVAHTYADRAATRRIQRAEWWLLGAPGVLTTSAGAGRSSRSPEGGPVGCVQW